VTVTLWLALAGLLGLWRPRGVAGWGIDAPEPAIVGQRAVPRGYGSVPKPPSRLSPLVVVAAISTGLATLLLLGLPGGAVAAVPLSTVGGAAAHALHRWQLHRHEAVGEIESVPLLLDLLAAALAAGSAPETAIAALSSAVDEAVAVAGEGASPLRDAMEPLRRVGRLLQLGADPDEAWSALDDVRGYQLIGAAGRRCATSGSRLAAGLAASASELREQRRAEAMARAERVGVWALLPLGLCFLPAFVCLGVVPVIVGIAGQVMQNGRS
jgi:pilus assembly protein TadC